MKTIVIIGAGAAGLACASKLSIEQVEANIIVLEQFNRSGRKLLASGNGRCNISNRDMDCSHYNTFHPTVAKILATFDPVVFFGRLGMFTKYEGNLLYPYSNQALTVKNALLHSMHNVSIIEECFVKKVIPQNSQYQIKTSQGNYLADYVVIATGSCASMLSGKDNYDIVKELGLKMVPLYPSLVQLKTAPAYKQLKGVRTKCAVSLYVEKQCIETVRGELLFNETGVSGICVMQLSRHYYKFLDKEVTLHIDLLPDYSKEEVKAMIKERQKTLKSIYLAGIFNNKLATLLEVLPSVDYKDWCFQVVGTKDFTNAQVMHGGVDLSQVNENLECKNYPNLYIVGEVLDVDGDCGGYNLHFAFGSGCHVAKNIKDRMNNNVKN